jgi:valyl-tRNA synthetase
VTQLFQSYDYAAAKSESEAFFWRELADNYLEMCKQRLYDSDHPQHAGARYTLSSVLLVLLKLLAPLLPYVTEEIFQGLFAGTEAGNSHPSIHTSAWPLPDPAWQDAAAEAAGESLVEIATAVRRYKSEHNLPLGTELSHLQIVVDRPELRQAMQNALPDLASITRALSVEVVNQLDPGLVVITTGGALQAAIQPAASETSSRTRAPDR